METKVHNMVSHGRTNRDRVHGEQLEKDRLKNRQFGFQRYESEEIDRPFTVYKSSESYRNDPESFTTDSAALERRERDAKSQRKTQVVETHRAHAQKREEDRLKVREQQWKHEDSKAEMLRDYTRQTKNKSGLAYDPITLQFKDGLDGSRMQLVEDQIRYRAALRSINLHQKGCGGHNPITGEPISFAEHPTKPVVSDELITKGDKM